MSLQPVLFCMSPLGVSFLSLLIILNGSPVRSQKQNYSQLGDLLEVGGDLMKPLEGQEGHQRCLLWGDGTVIRTVSW